MVRIEIAGRPILDIDAEPGDSGNLKTSIRRRMRGGSNIKFEWMNVQPRLVLTSDTDDFDETLITYFHQEGFQISYLPYQGDHKKYNNSLQHLADGLDLGEKYAIVGE
jgi:hypothetical protein